MRILANDRGWSKIKVFIWFIVLFVIIHVGFKLIPMYFDYSRMKDTMAVKAGLAQILKDHEIMRDLVNKARELELPLGKEDFIIERDQYRRRMNIKTAWVEEVGFFWGSYIHTFHFKPEVNKSFMIVRL